LTNGTTELGVHYIELIAKLRLIFSLDSAISDTDSLRYALVWIANRKAIPLEQLPSANAFGSDNEIIWAVSADMRNVLFDDANDTMQGAMGGCPIECIAFAYWWIQSQKGQVPDQNWFRIKAETQNPSATTASHLKWIASQLGNSCHVRYWLHYNYPQENPMIMAISVLTQTQDGYQSEPVQDLIDLGFTYCQTDKVHTIARKANS
jgi:hypothetical protein